MNSHFSPDFFANNRKRLCDSALSADCRILLIAGNGLIQRGADSPYPFSQDANFWYLTGIDEPDLTLAIVRDDKGKFKELILAPERSTNREAFDGVVDAQTMKARSGIKTIINVEKGWEKLGESIKTSKVFASVEYPPAYIDHNGLYTNPARAAMWAKVQKISPNVQLINVGKTLAGMRMVKQPEELAALQHAIDITIQTLQHVTAQPRLAKYKYEYELEAAITQGFRSRGATGVNGHGFDPIVACGEGAVTLHNVSNNAALQTGQLVTIDVGAEVEHYSADITRTVAVAGQAVSDRHRAVHAAVWEVQQQAIALLKPGVVLREYEKLVVDMIGQKLLELKLISDPTTDEIRRFYPHATSHFLGLNVHDIGDYDRPLEPGMVITVEPGIYIAAEGIGVRIEDDVLITKTGVDVLTKALPSKLA